MTSRESPFIGHRNSGRSHGKGERRCRTIRIPVAIDDALLDFREEHGEMALGDIVVNAAAKYLGLEEPYSIPEKTQEELPMR